MKSPLLFSQTLPFHPFPHLIFFQLLQILLLQPTFSESEANFGLYLPLSYQIPYHQEECLYERITNVGEHVTSSVFVVGGDELRAAVVFEGPVAPVEVQLGSEERDKKGKGGTAQDGKLFGGMELQKFINRYIKEGVKMFAMDKQRGGPNAIKPIRIQQMLDFEDEEEHFQYDDDVMAAAAAAHAKVGGGVDENGEEGEEVLSAGKLSFTDDYLREREEMLKKEVDREVEFDDDFVKLQLEHERKRDAGKRTGAGGAGAAAGGGAAADGAGAAAGGGGGAGAAADGGGGDGAAAAGGGAADSKKADLPDSPNRDNTTPRRRLEETPILISGEPWEHTSQIQTPGWYRLCVRAKAKDIDVEMELRKSSLYGKIDPETGHVPSIEEVELHRELHSLYEKELDSEIPKDLIKDEDLRVTREQLRVLERVYTEIIEKQLEERRTWNWRTKRNQHSYSHMVLGNLLETVLYMGITGWQVYTIRKWFGSGPTLGR